MRIGDKQYGTLDLGTNDITSAGDVSKALSTGFAFWKLIQEISLDADTATIEFNGIPQDFRHLILVGSFRTNRAETGDFVLVRLNGDSGANYDVSFFQVNDAASLAGGLDGPGITSFPASFSPGDPAPANHFGTFTLSIIDYANTSRHKGMHCISNVVRTEIANSMWTNISSARWRSTNSVTSLILLPESGTVLKSGSMASLYGTDV